MQQQQNIAQSGQSWQKTNNFFFLSRKVQKNREILLCKFQFFIIAVATTITIDHRQDPVLRLQKEFTIIHISCMPPHCKLAIMFASKQKAE